MTASELYDQLSNQTAALQRSLESTMRVDMNLRNQIAEQQAKMSKLMQIVIDTGDRELSGPELMDLNS